MDDAYDCKDRIDRQFADEAAGYAPGFLFRVSVAD